MTDARHVYVAAVARTDRHRADLEACELEVVRRAAILADSERLEIKALGALKEVTT